MTTKRASARKKLPKLNRSFQLKLELRSHPTFLCVVRGALEPLMESLGFSGEENRAIIRGVDEAVSNIMRHSYMSCPDNAIELRCNRLDRQSNGHEEHGVEILLYDCGPAIDTTKIQPRPLDEIRPGGLGLHIIRGSMDAVEYKRSGKLNRLRLVKYARGSKGGFACPEETSE